MSFNSKKQLIGFLAEDIGKKDITSNLLPKKKISARIISRENAILGGITHVKTILRLTDVKLRF